MRRCARNHPSVWVVLALFVVTVLPSSAQFASPLFAKETRPLTIWNSDGSGVQLLTVVVTSQEEKARGLMHIKHLPPNLSMLFLNQQPRLASMWMKDTHISLDILFVDADLSVAHIARHTTPLSTDTIRYNKPVIAVLEINAGLSDLLGIAPGSKIELDPQPD